MSGPYPGPDAKKLPLPLTFCFAAGVWCRRGRAECEFLVNFVASGATQAQCNAPEPCGRLIYPSGEHALKLIPELKEMPGDWYR